MFSALAYLKFLGAGKFHKFQVDTEIPKDIGGKSQGVEALEVEKRGGQQGHKKIFRPQGVWKWDEVLCSPVSSLAGSGTQLQGARANAFHALWEDKARFFLDPRMSLLKS